MAPFLVFIFAASMVLDFGATQQQFTSPATTAVNPLICTFTQFQSCQRIAQVFNMTTLDVPRRCRALSEAMECFQQLLNCPDKSLQSYALTAIQQVYNTQVEFCPGSMTSTTSTTLTTPAVPLNCTMAKLKHCQELESLADGITNQSRACRSLESAKMCYTRLFGCQSFNFTVFTEAYNSALEIISRCPGSRTSTYKPPSTTYKPTSTYGTSPKPNNCTMNKLYSCHMLEQGAIGITDQTSRCMALNRAKTCFSHLLVCAASNYQLYLDAKNRIASIESRCQGVGGTCSAEQFHMCVGHLPSMQNNTKIICSEMQQSLKCLDNMGACDDNLYIKMQIESVKPQLNSALTMMCNPGCSQDDLVQCTLQLQTLGQYTNDLRMMCNVWWNSKTCLYNLTRRCERNSSIQTTISMILRNVSSSLSFCSSYSSCSNTSMKSCMNGLDYAAPGYPRCEAAMEAERCIERTQLDCRDPESRIKAKQFLAMIWVAQREYCGGDGDGDGPSGAGHVNVMLPLLVVMSLVAKIYN